MRKQAYGPWMMKAFALLARCKGLRGTAFDPFGHTEERRTERALIGEYQDTVNVLIAGLGSHNHALALQIAALPEGIKGFGHVKARNLAAVRQRWADLMAQWHAPVSADTDMRRSA